MAHPPPLLRPAAPTPEDGVAYARLLNVAAAGLYKLMLGRKYADVISRAFVEPGHDHSFEHATFAERDGRVVGMIDGYTAEDHELSDSRVLVDAAEWRRHRMGAWLRIMARLFDFMDRVPVGDYYVQAFAVRAAHRGRGIGSLLLDSIEDQARSAGSHRIVLDVASKNRDGRRLYERRGMMAEAESPRWFGLPNTNVIRMVKDL